MNLNTLKYIVIGIIFIYILRYCQLCCIRKIFRSLLIKIVNEFEKEKVNYWIDFGTLLGIYRNKDIILGDGDVDICVTTDPENLDKVRCIVNKFSGKELDWGAFRIYFYDKYFHVDIYKAKTILKNNTLYFSIPSEVDEDIPVDLILPIVKKSINVGGKMIIAAVPEKIHEVLLYRYGKSYMIPYQKWYYLWLDIERIKKDLKL